MKRIATLACVMLAISAAVSTAQVPRKISYQGVLKASDGIVAPEGDYTFEFRICTLPSGGSVLWTETQVIHVAAGIVDATLGTVTPLSLDFEDEYWLAVAVDGGAEMAPRTRLTAAPYAICSEAVLGTTNVFPAGGNVGAGTTAPSADLHVYNDIDGTTSVRIENPNAGSSSVERLDFTDENGSVCGIAVFDEGHPSYAGRMNIFNNRPGGSMHLIAGGGGVSIADDGKVGVDRADPLEQLDVDGAIRIASTSSGNAGTIRWTGSDFEGYDGSSWHSLTSGGTGGELPPGAWKQTLYHDGSDWVASSSLVNDGSDIGIGTTDPAHPLHVVSPEIRPVKIEGTAGGAWALLTIDAAGVGSAPGIEYQREGVTKAYEYVDPGDDYRLFLGGSVRLTVEDTEGNVGIGVSAPDAPLHLAGLHWDLDATEGDLKIGDSVCRLKIGIATGGMGAGSAGIRVQGGLQRLLLGAGSEEIVEITTGGRVMIGSDHLSGDLDLYRDGVTAPVLTLGSDVNGGRQVVTDENGNIAVQINADNSGTGGFVWVARNETGAGIELNGNWGYSEEPRLTLYGSTQSAGFRLDETGDGSVSLPAGAVNSAEILDEPGTAAEAANTSLMLDGTVQAILSRTITAPAAGYVLVVGTCQPRANHTAGTNSFADFGVSDLGTAFPSNQDVEFRVPSTAASGMYCIPATVTGLFAVTSGSHTFHLLGRENSGDFEIFDAQLTLVYLPTAYGTVVETMRMAGDPFDDAAPGRPAVDAGAAALERDASIAADRARVDRELAAMRAELEDVKRLMEEERNR